MLLEEKKTINDFWVIGISYRNTDVETRSRFAINEAAYHQILETAASYGTSELFVLSTCNRTEVYGFTKDPELLMSLVCRFTEGNLQEFKNKAYQKNSTLALSHIFNVAGGIDSQILGDYEIVGQMKHAFNFAKEKGTIGKFMDRLFSTVLQSSRSIRSKTDLSAGTVSVAYAAVYYLKQKFNDLGHQQILTIGTGEIGHNTCKNLVQEFGANNITIVNRSKEKAAPIAEELGVRLGDFADLNGEIKKADIIIVATNAPTPLVNKEQLLESGAKTLIDLSIPSNINKNVKEVEGITFVNVDDLSKINDETLRKREAEIPKAKALITYHIHEFAEWYLMRQNVPVLRAAKEKIQELNQQLFEAVQEEDTADKVQKVLNNMAMKLKNESRPGCFYIEAINDYMNSCECLMVEK